MTPENKKKATCCDWNPALEGIDLCEFCARDEVDKGHRYDPTLMAKWGIEEDPHDRVWSELAVLEVVRLAAEGVNVAPEVARVVLDAYKGAR